MVSIRVLRVFVDGAHAHGNLLGVVLDGLSVAPDDRQDVARRLGFSETVFVDDAERAEVRIFTPKIELQLAGHPLVGTSWLLANEGLDVEVLRPPAGEVATWREAVDEGEATFIRGPLAGAPPWLLVELADPATVAATTGPREPVHSKHGMAYYWAWDGQAAIRSRAFAPVAGIEQDEATGSAAMLIAAQLGRAVSILQGEGSVLYARPAEAGYAEVGGLVVEDEGVNL